MWNYNHKGKHGLNEYSFWRDVESAYKKIRCPHCGHDMAVRRIGKERILLFLCSKCPFCTGLENVDRYINGHLGPKFPYEMKAGKRC